MQDNNSNSLLWFVAGVALGATVALLFAPASGQVTRRRLKRKAEEGRDAIAEVGDEVAEKGKELFNKGRKLADEAAELFERGRKLVEG